MLVDLRELKPNPMRDFTVDPMDDGAVEMLRVSIQEDGFWGGVVCRRKEDGSIEIGAGHHRIKAAIAAGIESADIFVSNEMDDAAMVRVYARENATQRSNNGTAQAGSVASAIRFIAKAVLGGAGGSIQLDGTDLSIVQGNLASDKGLGYGVIVNFLSGVPGICQKSVQQALANLKSSGNYARIIGEVKDEIERENREALAALERAEREQKEAEERQRRAEDERREAAAKAKAAKQDADRKRAELDRQKAEAEAKLAERRRKEADEKMKGFAALRKTRDTATKAATVSAAKPVTFDFEGVSKHLGNAHQIDVFREVVTGQGIAPYLPVANQAALANHVVDLAKKRGKELSGVFIRENVASLILEPKRFERELSKEEKRSLLEKDLGARSKQYQHDFAGYMRSAIGVAVRLMKLQEECLKEGVVFPTLPEFPRIVEDGKKLFDSLNERF